MLKRSLNLLVAAATLGIVWYVVAGPSSQGKSGSVVSAGSAGGEGGPAPPIVPVVVVQASSRNMIERLHVSGDLRTDENVAVGGPPVPIRVTHVLVNEGDRVKSGQLMVRFSTLELDPDIERARALVQAAEAQLDQARHSAVYDDAAAANRQREAAAGLGVARARLEQARQQAGVVATSTDADVRSAQAAVRVAEQRVIIAREQTRKQELREAELVVAGARNELTQADAELENAARNLDRHRELFARDAVPRAAVDDAETQHKVLQARHQVAQGRVSAAEARLDLAQEGARPEEVRVAEQNVLDAQEKLRSAEANRAQVRISQDQVRTMEEAVRQAEAALNTAEAGLVQSSISEATIRAHAAEVARARADLDILLARREQRFIRAPVDGVVSRRYVHVGETSTPGQALLDLVALDDVFLEATVPELEISRVRPGDAAEITVDALPGIALTGAVREIIPVAGEVSREFRIRVSVRRPQGVQLPPGGFARASISVAVRRGALAISKDALRSEAGVDFVYRVESDEGGKLVARRQRVEVGLRNPAFIEILGGVTPGDRLVTLGSPAIVDGTPVEIVANPGAPQAGESPSSGGGSPVAVRSR